MPYQEKIIKTVMPAKKLKSILEKYLKPTDSIEVHTSLSAFGYIPGGEQSVVRVLKEVVNQGNIIMAAQTADIGDPIDWEDPPATSEARKEIMENMSAFDKETTPIHYIGKTPEYFRTSKDVKRSNHPLYSMCAWGKDADKIARVRDSYDYPFGLNSPVADLYNLDGKVVMLGTDYESCTSLHLADSTIGRPNLTEKAPIKGEDGKTKWITFKNVDDLDKYDDFNDFGSYFEEKYPDLVVKVPILKGYIRIIPVKPLIDEARKYYTKKDKEMAEEANK